MMRAIEYLLGVVCSIGVTAIGIAHYCYIPGPLGVLLLICYSAIAYAALELGSDFNFTEDMRYVFSKTLKAVKYAWRYNYAEYALQQAYKIKQ